jgi:hypothetical protein
VVCGSIVLKVADLELIIKLIHKFVEDFQIASSIESLVGKNWTDFVMWRQTPVVPMTSGCHRTANNYRHASHEARYAVIYACSKPNKQSLRHSNFLGSSTERITL